MRTWFIVGLLVMAFPTAGMAGMGCPDWKSLDKEGKRAAIADMIEGELTGTSGQRFTGDAQSAIAGCLAANAGRMTDDMDHECSSSGTAKDPVDGTFERYLLSCM